MAATTAQVVARVEELDLLGEFSSATWDTPKQNLASAALRKHTESAWLEVFLDAMAWWVLHWLKLAALAKAVNAGGAGGPITAIRTGNESVVFQAVTNKSTQSDALLLRTSYGQEYMALRDSRPDAHIFLTDL